MSRKPWRDALESAAERPARDYRAALDQLAAANSDPDSDSDSVPAELDRERVVHARLESAFGQLEVPQDGLGRVLDRLSEEPRPFGLESGSEATSSLDDELDAELSEAYDAVPVPDGLLDRLSAAIDREEPPKLPDSWREGGAGDARLPFGGGRPAPRRSGGRRSGELRPDDQDFEEPEAERGRLFLGADAEPDVKAAERLSPPQPDKPDRDELDV